MTEKAYREAFARKLDAHGGNPELVAYDTVTMYWDNGVALSAAWRSVLAKQENERIAKCVADPI